MGYLIGIIIVLAIALSIIGGVFNGALEGGAFMLSKVIAGGELRFGIFFVVCALACTLLAHLCPELIACVFSTIGHPHIIQFEILSFYLFLHISLCNLYSQLL